MTPSVSVVVATYRREDALKNALLSLAAQDTADFEVVLVDDNGCEEWNERVRKIVDGVMTEYPSLSLNYIVNSPNQGSAKTRNIGIAAAKGEYVTFLDDDDVYLPAKVSRQLKFMREGGYDYSVTDLDLYDENDRLTQRRVRSDITDTTPEGLLRYHLMHHITGTDTMMFKKEYLEKIGGFAPIDVGDEFYLMHRAISGGGRFGHLPGSDIKAYVHTGEGGLSSGEQKIKGEMALYEYKKEYISSLDGRSRRYIKMRHYAVLAFATLRVKRVFATLGYCFMSFISAPIQCVKLFFGRKL